MGKTTDTFGRSKFWMPQNSLFLAKTCAAGRANNIELSMLVLDFMVKCRLMEFLWNPWNVLRRMRRRIRKKMTLSVHRE